MRGAMARQAAISNNLANVNTTGFRAEIANAETRWIKGDNLNTRAQASEQVIAADMAQGAVTETGNPLDEIGRAHVRTPVTNAHIVCSLLLDKKNTRHIK